MMASEKTKILCTDNIKIIIDQKVIDEREEYYTRSIKFWNGIQWEVIFEGLEGAEFSTSFKNSSAHTCQIESTKDGDILILTANNGIWEAKEEISIDSTKNLIIRTQKYSFHVDCEGYINPGYLLKGNATTRYTYPLQVYDKNINELQAIRCDSAWAVPLPCHIISNKNIVVVYGLDRNKGTGTLDFQPVNSEGYVRIGTFYPDTVQQDKSIEFNLANRKPDTCTFYAGQQIELVEFISITNLEADEIPLLKAEKIAAELLLKEPFPKMDWVNCADRIEKYYTNCSLWEPNAFGKGHGWFRNMWVYTMATNPQKDPYFDLGWGEGYGVLTMVALALNWKRSGNDQLRLYLNEMTKNIDYFKRNSSEPGMLYDRYNLPNVKTLLKADANGGTDFMGLNRIWSHCLGNIGYQLLNLYKTMEGYPDVEIRKKWLETGREIAEFFARMQMDNGNIQSGFDENNREANKKSYNIPARSVVCGLWTLMAEISGDKTYIERALKLAHYVSGEIEQFNFYGQMIDSHGYELDNISDSENACYTLLGLTELYIATSDEKVHQLCKISAAYLFSWVYFYNLPNGFNGWTRGGTTCRMPDFPLLYVGAGALAFIPLVKLAEKTGDTFYQKMAQEILGCIAKYQWQNTDKPWDGAIVHALDQNSGVHWGPERLGQVDSGMTTGMALADLEYWISKN